MVNFWMYDVGFMFLFSIFIAWFLYSRKKDLSREGIIFLYRTKFGIKAINYIGDNFKQTLHSIKYLIIGIGFLLMGVMLWMLGKTASIYLLNPEITKIIKAPPIAPLIPYFPKLFGMESFFPPFYFTYFIVALAIVAIVHEFSHGIFMRLFKVKIKSTGIVFLGPILGAFVEQDDKSFNKKSKIEQMSVLGAGVFANVVFALIFYGLYVVFFFTSFTASGYIFNSYATETIPLQSIYGFEEFGNFTKVSTLNGNYYLDGRLALQLNQSNGKYLIAYSETPAILAKMRGAIIQADNVKITGQDKLREFLKNKNPGDEVKFLTEDNNKVKEYNVILSERPDNSSIAYLGVGYRDISKSGFVRSFLNVFMGFKDSSTFYKPTWNGEFVYFIYYLLWWIMIINLLVALFNMLPVGILDGGRFFYLTILGITRSEKIAKMTYKAMGYVILFIFLIMMFFWFIGIM